MMKYVPIVNLYPLLKQILIPNLQALTKIILNQLNKSLLRPNQVQIKLNPMSRNLLQTLTVLNLNQKLILPNQILMLISLNVEEGMTVVKNVMVIDVLFVIKRNMNS